jgi:hypothetical protein
MKKRKQEFIGSFTALNNKQELKKIIISQDILPHYCGNSNHSKNLFLETMNGIQVFKTEDPNIFQLSDGSLLKKKGASQLHLE